MKFIFVTGGVVSSLGKGLTAAALGTLLENRGLKVTLQKILTPTLTSIPTHNESLSARRGFMCWTDGCGKRTWTLATTNASPIQN